MKERVSKFSPKGYDLPKCSLQLLNMILSSAFCHSDPKQVILKNILQVTDIHTCIYIRNHNLPPSEEALILNFPNKENGLIQATTNL